MMYIPVANFGNEMSFTPLELNEVCITCFPKMLYIFTFAFPDGNPTTLRVLWFIA